MIYVNKATIPDEHAHGTKVFVYPSKEDAARLYDFVKNTLKIDKPVKASQYHCTVIYSSASCGLAERHPIKVPMTGNIYGWRIFESPTLQSKCLVALLSSNEIRTLNRELIDSYGATSNFPTFIPHITVAWGYEGEVPKDVPKGLINFDAYKVAGIDPNWTPADLDK